MSNQKASIIIISYNNWSFTKICLESIVENTIYPDYEIIIIDNASDQNTIHNLQSYTKNSEHITIQYNLKNYGFAKANNQGAKIANGKYLAFLNNDTIVSQGWLKRLIKHLQNIPGAGMVGPVTNAIGNEAKVDIDYTEPSISSVKSFAEQRTAKFQGQYFKINNLALYCCVISKSLFEKVGGLDERYKIGTFEDDDLAMKIKQKGFSLFCAEDVFIHHFHGTSFNKLSKLKRRIIFEINKFKFENKWKTKWVPHQNKPS